MGTRDFFTVDRLGTLSEGRTVELVLYNDVTWKGKLPESDLLYDGGRAEDELQAHVNHLFPHGVSSHGSSYFLTGSRCSNVTNPLIELVFEYVRRGCFPDRPSRFECLFACESLEQARVFREQYGNGSIWKVQCDNVFRADMALLALGQESILLTSYHAHRYWSGLTGYSRQPFWEWLLVPPIRVLERAEGVVTRGLDLRGSDLRDVRFDDKTQWPNGIGKRDPGTGGHS